MHLSRSPKPAGKGKKKAAAQPSRAMHVQPKGSPKTDNRKPKERKASRSGSKKAANQAKGSKHSSVQNRFSNVSSHSGYSKSSPSQGIDREYKDPLDYDSESDYEAPDVHEVVMPSTTIDFRNDYEPLRFGLRHEKMAIVLEY